MDTNCGIEVVEIWGRENPIWELNSGNVGNKVKPPRIKENIPEMLDFPIVFPVIKSNAKVKIPRRINSTLNKVEISENLPKKDKKEASENAPQ